MKVSVLMHIGGVSTNHQLDNLSNEELKNVVLMCQLGGIVIDIESVTHIMNELWDDRKGGPRCELAYDQEFCEALQWHSQSDEVDD